MKALSPVLVTAPADPLLTLDEAKAHLRVDTTDQDSLITGLIAATESYLDGYSGVLGRAIRPQSWSVSFDFLAGWRACLPLGRLIEVESITYYDLDDTQQTFSTSNYYAINDAEGPAVIVKNGVAWPATFVRPDAITIQWQCGFDVVPVAIKQAALLLIGQWFDNRSAVIDSNKAIEMPLAVRALLRPFSLIL